jgi:hypothetical protein
MLCKTLANQVYSEGPEGPTEINARHKKSSLLRGKFDRAGQLQSTEGPQFVNDSPEGRTCAYTYRKRED